MSKTITSGSITYIDTTDSRKLDVYIANNMPTVQIYNPNNQNPYSPDWTTNNLTLTASIYLDSIDVTNNEGMSIIWDKQIGTNVTSDIARGKTLTIKDNISSTNNIITYICRASYKGVSAQHKIDFTRVVTGVNGTDGSPAPAVQAQYSVDGSAWTSTLNAATHKYIRYSYDGGKTWTTAIKMVGEDGTSVRIKGTATSATSVAGTDYYTLVYSGSSITGAEIGDSYLYNGDLYVCADSRDGQDYFINVGGIQGPKGSDGLSSYVFIRYATDANGTGMSTSPSGKTYMGVYTSNTNVAPTTANSYTWSKFVGDSAKSIILSGDSQVFKVSTSNVYTPATIKVTAQAFNTSVTTWTYSTNGGQTFVSTAPMGVSISGNVATITGSTLTTNSLVVKASDGTYSDVFTVYKAFDGTNGNPGAPGTPASMAFLTNENVTFSANSSGVITSATISTNVVAYNGATKTTPTIGTIASLPTGMTATVGTVVNNEVPIVFTVTNSNLGSALNNNGSITIPVNGPVYTNLILTWSKVNSGGKGDKGDDGSDAYTVLLTNESHVFAGDVNNAIAGTAETQALAYIGATPQTVKIISVNEKTAAITDTDTGIDGLKFKCDTLSGTSPKITFTCTTSFKSASGTIPIKLSVGGVEFIKMFTYSIAFKGATGGTGAQGPQGQAATSYWLISSAIAVQKTSTGTITVTPSTLTFTGKSKTGTNAPVDYACRWIIDSSTDGTTYTNLYTSTANEASKSITVATTYKTIRARMYMAGGTTALLDEQIIPVVTDGAKGDTGRGISKITEYYLATTAASDVTTATSGWTETVQTIDSAKKYLWNYELITYTNNTISITPPVIIGVFGNTGATGKGIKSVTEYYLATSSSSGVTTSTSGWKDTMQTLTSTNKYLWNYELITYTDNSTATISPVIIGVYGDQGIQGVQGPKGNDAYTVILTNESHIFAGDVSNAIAGSATTQVLAYNGSTAQTVTIVSVNGKTAAATDTDTGIAGLKFKCSALSGASPTITFTCTISFVSKSGTIPIVLSVGGVSFTKMFTYSIAFKGTTGSPGNPGSPGTPASLVDITPSALYFKSTTGKGGTFTPDYIYLYPRFQTVAYSKWEYSINGGASWTTVTSGANGLNIGTYNSVAYSLQIAKNSALYTDTVTSISFRCVSSNSAVYDTVSIAKIYDVVDLQIGGRNLAIGSAANYTYSGFNLSSDTILGGDFTITNETYKSAVISKWSGSSISTTSGPFYNISDKFGVTLEIGSTYTVSAWVKADTETVLSKSGLAEKQTIIAGQDHVGTEWSRIWVTFKATSTSFNMCFYTTRNATTEAPYIYMCGIKLEQGNKATDWSPAPEDMQNITFQIYAPNGYLLTNELQSLELQTFAYEGSIEITSGATFQWSQLIDNVWTAISGATSTSLTVTKADVLRAKSYRCVMTYKSKEYTSTITVQDKTDAYNSIMCMSSNATNGECYWVLYTLVYSDTGEVDPLLGPISISAPTTPVSGDYWYSVDAANATVQLKKYNDTAWVNSTDKQSLTYLWNIVNDGSLKTPIGGNGKVQVISCHDFTATATLVCDVSNEVDGILTQSSLSITDASDPIVSETEPTGIVNGQIWIKPNSNGTYFMSVWDATNNTWISSDMDTRNKVYTSKPASYNKGDIWITESNTAHSSYREGTLLVASADSVTYNASHWSATLKYDKDIGEIEKTLYNLSQYVDITTLGLRIGARNSAGELSPFTSLFTSTELAFYQNSEKLLTLANNQLTAPRVVVEEDLEVQGTISLGGLQFTIETNGSFSFAVKT